MNILESLKNNERIEPMNNEIEFESIDDLSYEFKKNNSSILHVIIRSLNANLAMLKPYINCLSLKPMIIICTESWTVINTNLYNIEGCYKCLQHLLQ